MCSAKNALLFVTRKWPPAIGGMESYSVSLAGGLKTHFDVALKVLPGNPNGNPPGLLSYALFLVRAMIHILVRGRHYRFLVLGDLVLFPAGILARLVAPQQTRGVIFYGLDLVFHRRRGVLPALYRLYLALFARFQHTFAAKVAISTHTRFLAEGAGISNVAVIIPCVPDSALTTSTPSLANLPASVSRSSCRILCFGRLVPRKGAEWFAARVLPHLPEHVEFFVVGAPTDSEYQRRLIRYARTHYLGPQPSEVLAALIAYSEVVVMPNISTAAPIDVEGFGLAALEAASLGAVLVASRLQGITDAVIDGKTGILVEAEDATAWIRVIRALLAESADQRVVRRLTAKTTSRHVFSQEKLAFEFATLLDDASDLVDQQST
jgi:glycosyltransferase involved in cell wall biosynthesis